MPGAEGDIHAIFAVKESRGVDWFSRPKWEADPEVGHLRSFAVTASPIRDLTATIEQYQDQWPLPEGLLRWASNTRQVRGLAEGCKVALDRGQPIEDWGHFVTKSLPPSCPTETA